VLNASVFGVAAKTAGKCRHREKDQHDPDGVMKCREGNIKPEYERK
jgi:hypothetical protein